VQCYDRAGKLGLLYGNHRQLRLQAHGTFDALADGTPDALVTDG
jgi:hypothetical protein